MSIFGQVWLWSLLAFVVGALLTWLILVLPAQQRIRLLQSRLAAVPAESTPIAARPREATSTAYFGRPAVTEQYAGSRPGTFAEPELEAWTRETVVGYEPEPALWEPATTEYIDHPEPEPEPEPVAEEPEPIQPEPDLAEYLPEAQWFDDELEPERAAFEEPAARHHPQRLEAAPYGQPADPTTGETPAYGFSPDEQESPGSAETSVESTQNLPKRPRRESPRGGFDPPAPIQPSMRAIERREPPTEVSGGHSGSLFEPVVQPGQSAASPAPEPPPARHPVLDSVPPGPFGPGSAMPRPGGGRPAEEFGVKASVTALRYCSEDSAQFPRMVAEVWFRTPADAERVGFRPLN